MDRKVALTVLVAFLVVVAAGAAFSFWKYKSSGLESHEFVGTVKKVEGTTLAVEGSFVVPNHPELNKPENKKTVSVMTDSQTKIIKERLHLPSADELKDTGGRYDPSKLKRDQVAGSVDELKEFEASISIKSNSDIYGKSSFRADEIRYIEPVYPE